MRCSLGKFSRNPNKPSLAACPSTLIENTAFVCAEQAGEGAMSIRDLSFWNPVGRERSQIALSAVVGVQAAVVAVLSALAYQALFNVVYPNQGWASYIGVGAGLLLAAAWQFVMPLFRSRLMSSAGAAYDARVANSLYGLLVGMVRAHIPSSSRVNVLFPQHESVRNTVQALAGVVIDVPTLAVYTAAMALISPWSAFVAVVLFVVAMAVCIGVTGRLEACAEGAAGVHTARGSLLVETVQGIDEIKCCRAETTFADKHRKIAEAGAIESQRLHELNTLGLTVSSGCQNLAQVLVTLICGYDILTGDMTVGGSIAAGFIARFMLQLVGSLAGSGMTIGRGLTSAKMLKCLTATQQERMGGYVPDGTSDVGAVAFEGVRLFYPGALTPALDGVGVAIKPGARIAIVGDNGSGKSTFVKALVGLVAPGDDERDSGVVKVGGVSVSAWDLQALRGMVFYMGQNPFIFSGTVAENVSMGVPNATEAEIVSALQQSGAWDFVSRHPFGHQMPVAEMGANLSGGECRKLAWARLFLRLARGGVHIVIIDEGTANIDPASCARLVGELKKSIDPKTTVIVVSHDQTMMTLCAEAMFFKGGRIAAVKPIVVSQQPVAVPNAA